MRRPLIKVCSRSYIIEFTPETLKNIHFNYSSKHAATVHTAIGGVTGLLDDILSMLPQDGIFILFFDKLDSSLAFSNLVELLGSAEFQLKFDALRVYI